MFLYLIWELNFILKNKKLILQEQREGLVGRVPAAQGLVSETPAPTQMVGHSSTHHLSWERVA